MQFVKIIMIITDFFWGCKFLHFASKIFFLFFFWQFWNSTNNILHKFLQLKFLCLRWYHEIQQKINPKNIAPLQKHLVRYTIIRWYFSFACILQQIRISVYLIRKYKMLDKMEAWVSKFRTLIQTYWRRLFFSSLFKIFILLI